ncbi:DNA internalization-related competence protein ComEC/Rec2 [Deinococcus sonorensis]|uniref:DNA internalization-related competence protein ComEC/Rec2 n=2 Tax=Deinococcus sonorensis TaxID=309891 RepID=A0AAU7UE38_9DEIO
MTRGQALFPAPLAITPAHWWERLPPTLPPLLGLMAGILLGFGSGWGWPAALLALALCVPGRRWPLALLAVLACGLGCVREQAWWNAPDPLAGYIGAQLTLQGDWDGQLLHLRDPASAVALSPRPTLGPGPLRVSGVLVRPPPRRIPGGFDARFWLRAQGVRAELVAARVRSHQPQRGLKGWFRRGLTAGLPAREAALMQAIELGDKAELGQQTFDDGQAVQASFARAGLSHLMALSGQNVALLIGGLTLLLTRLPGQTLGRWRYPAMLLFLLGFLWLVGPSPSITRAVLMGMASLGALWAGRGRLDLYGVLALTALVGLTWQPGWLFDLGFQLSYLAVLGLSLSGRAAALLPPRWPEPLRLALVGTVLAEVATLPLVAGSFGQLPLVGLPANLLAELIMAALVPLGFVAGLLGPWSGPLQTINHLLLDALLGVAQTFGHAPVLPWGQVSAAGVAAYAVFALAGALTLTGRLPLRSLALVTLLCVLGTALPGRLQLPREVVYLDVGQGDSTLLRLNGLEVLVDGGGTPRGDYDVGARTVVPALRALGVTRLNVVVATHADADHIEGLISVLQLMRVGELWVGQPKRSDPLMGALIATAQTRHIPVREVRRGDHLQAGDLSLTVLWPQGAPWAAADNDNSVALRLDGPQFHTALLGDLPDPAEERLGVGRLDLLKLAHHGSRFSSSAAFLAETQPRAAIISVGRNSYGHPNAAVLERLRQQGVQVWRTDELGTIRWPIP